MRSDFQAWQGRLLAAALSLALVVVSVVGAYAHASGHVSPAAEHGTIGIAGVHAGHHGVASDPGTSKPGPGHIGHNHDCDGTGYSTLDCCDGICHGGQAILAGFVLVLHRARSAPLIESVAQLHGTEPGGLDRPPKSPRPA